MKKYITLLAMVLALTSAAAAAGAPAIDLEQEYRKLDRAIEQSETYVQQREQRIATFRAALGATADDGVQYEMCRNLYEQYRPYMSDSALHYIERCITLAERTGQRARADECRMLQAYQCAESGMYLEAADIMGSINEQTLAGDEGLQRQYYSTLAHLYRELGYYSKVPALQARYYALQDQYNRKIDALGLPQSDDEALQMRELECYVAGDTQGALRYSDMRLAHVARGTHQYAIVAFYRYLDYTQAGDSVQSRYWVTQSALSDVENAIMDQGAMWELANRLMADGDIDRAYRYIRFAWQCAHKFNTLKRSNQISPVLTAISDGYEASLKHRGRQLLVMAVAASLLAALLLAALLYSMGQRKKLARTQRQLSQINSHLAEQSAQLAEQGSRLHATNVQLAESNRIKDEYVGRFIHLCSFYIDRLDEMRRRVGKMVKSRDLDALYKFTEAGELRDKNLRDLYEMFDTTFLQLFPRFVDDFNALLRPECRVTLPEQGGLTTDVRIFALIRLGIDDSSRIADFLHYSVNTIYNYRAKVKNGALGDRDTFEARVKAIGSEAAPAPSPTAPAPQGDHEPQ